MDKHLNKIANSIRDEIDKMVIAEINGTYTPDPIPEHRTWNCSDCRFFGVEGGPGAVMVCNHPMCKGSMETACIISWGSKVSRQERYSDHCPMVVHNGSLLGKLYAVDGGRFTDLLMAVNVNDCCTKCSFFIPGLPKDQQYRCHCTGSCIDKTIHPDLKSYLLEKIGL